jgi:hypothetical protein
MSDDDLISQLETCTLPEQNFHHADHLHAAWVYLTRFSATEAITKFPRFCVGTQLSWENRIAITRPLRGPSCC